MFGSDSWKGDSWKGDSWKGDSWKVSGLQNLLDSGELAS
jgi:hypothetical protein